jgi:hypothetical protein
MTTRAMRVRVFTLLIRLQIVRLVEVDRIDLREVDELEDLDRLRRLGTDPREVLVGDHDVLALLVLVAAHDLVVGNLLVIERAAADVLDAPLVLLMEKVEAHVVRADRGLELDGDRDQAEVDRAVPECVGHRCGVSLAVGASP